MVRCSVVVTGTSSGIGRRIAERFGQAGWSVVGLDVFVPQNRSPHVAETILGDVRERSNHEAAAAAAEQLAPLAAWINCAGIDENQSVHLATREHVERVIDVNLLGVFWGCAVAVGSMLGHGGSIVNISSVQAVRGNEGYPAYAASKGGILGLTTQIAAEYASEAIRCNAILPGVIATEMNQKLLDAASDPERLERSWRALTPIGRFGTPSDVAELALFLCDDRGSFMTGSALPVDGGQLAMPPNWVFTREDQHD